VGRGDGGAAQAATCPEFSASSPAGGADWELLSITEVLRGVQRLLPKLPEKCPDKDKAEKAEKADSSGGAVTATAAETVLDGSEASSLAQAVRLGVQQAQRINAKNAADCKELKRILRDNMQKQQEMAERVQSRLAYQSLQFGERALFLRVAPADQQPNLVNSGPHGSHYRAYTVDGGNYYLSPESEESLRRKLNLNNRPEPEHVVGQVVHIEGPLTPAVGGEDENPFGLPVGTAFYIVTAELMHIA